MRQNMSAALATRRTATENPYTRWLHTWLKCDEAPGSLTLIDSSGNGNHVSPNFAPVWRPLFTVGTASYLKCMRPATPFNSGMLIEPTAVGASGGITGATEPDWGAMTPGTSLTENAGPNSITWTFRTPTINLGPNGVTPGLGGAVCVPKSSGGFERMFGFMNTDTWTYTANTLSCTTTDINDSAGAIPAGLAVGNILLSTGWASLDNQGVSVVTAVAANKITIPMFAADTNGGATPITLRRVNWPYSVAICARVVPQIGSFTNPAHLFRAGPTFGTGSFGIIRAYLRENASRSMICQLLSPALGDATSANSATLAATPTSTHFCAVWDRDIGNKTVYLDSNSSATQTIRVEQRALLRDLDPVAWANRIFQLSFFHGDAKVAYKDVQLYVMPIAPYGMMGSSSFRDIIKSIMAGNGPPLASEWT